MIAISGERIDDAWRAALSAVIEAGGKVPNLVVEIGSGEQDQEVRAAVDDFVATARAGRGSKPWPVATVANTIFPQAFYRPERDDPEGNLYRLHEKSLRVHGRRRNSEHYFDRMVRWPGSEGPVNQLAVVLGRIRHQLDTAGPKRSEYEIAVAHPVDGDIRVQAPGLDTQYMHFPCLSHVSLTVIDRTVHLTALYRNQYLVSRAYGNYVGLHRLAAFVALQTGCAVGQVVCVASHADAEVGQFGVRRLQSLVNLQGRLSS